MQMKPILAALLTVAALPAAAQQAPGAPPMPHRDHAMMAQRRADDLALLLDLKPAQRPALDAFLKASRPGWAQGRPGRRPEGTPQAGAGTTPPSFTQRLDRMDEFGARRAEAGHQRIAATKAFYQSLDPHQQQLFEAVMRMRHGRGGHGGHGGGWHGGRPGGPMPAGAPQD